MIKFPVEKFKSIETPFYYYDMDILKKTLDEMTNQIKGKNYKIHFAIKANFNERVLEVMKNYGLGIDCVSGNEVEKVIKMGFESNKIVYAGVGKTEKEIRYSIENNILCFNVESEAELDLINKIAKELNKKVNIAFRINPDIDSHSHAKITTGTKRNKFGIEIKKFYEIVDKIISAQKEGKDFLNINFIGIHFHIGSQVLNLDFFNPLCDVVSDILNNLDKKNIKITFLDLGGGLGIDYEKPKENLIPNFKGYFELFESKIKFPESYKEKPTFHFELGRSLVANCGYLISRITYLKENFGYNFIIIDAGMNDLMRPALYGSKHHMENISNTNEEKKSKFDVVGPVCESSDVFDTDVELTEPHQGDFIAMFSAGAYGEAMASRYNCREFAKAYYSDTL